MAQKKVKHTWNLFKLLAVKEFLEIEEERLEEHMVEWLQAGASCETSKKLLAEGLVAYDCQRRYVKWLLSTYCNGNAIRRAKLREEKGK